MTPENVYADTEYLVSAEDIGIKGTNMAIQDALNQAKYYASDSNKVVVKVEPGEYTVSSALFLYSNTIVDLTGVEIKRSTRCNIFRVGLSEASGCLSGVTGYLYRNITIKNGELSGNNNSATIV